MDGTRGPRGPSKEHGIAGGDGSDGTHATQGAVNGKNTLSGGSKGADAASPTATRATTGSGDTEERATATPAYASGHQQALLDAWPSDAHTPHHVELTRNPSAWRELSESPGGRYVQV